VFDSYIGTTNGIHRLSDGVLASLGLESQRITAVHASIAEGTTVVLAGSYGDGLYRSTDGGRTWSRVEAGLTAPAFRFLGPDPVHPGGLLAGTEPARLFRSADSGQTWKELEAIGQLPGHDRWFLPYSPRGGALRNVYSPPGRPDRLFASLEVGGLLKSADGGASWVCEPVIADEDVHHVTGRPDDSDALYVSLGTAALTHPEPGEKPSQLGGIARSRDGGQSWEKVETDYTRATIVPPSRPELLLAGPATRVGQGGRIVVSTDGGDSWRAAGMGIDIPMPDMVELFVAAPDDSVWAICSRGRLLRADADAGDWNWHSALPHGSRLEVKSVAFVPRESL
jgi:BNR/Asp-box repeat